MKTFKRSAFAVVATGLMLITASCSSGGGDKANDTTTTVATTTVVGKGKGPKSTDPKVIAYCKARAASKGKVNLATAATAKASLPYVKAVTDVAPPQTKAANQVMLETVTRLASPPATVKNYALYKKSLLGTPKLKNSYKVIVQFSAKNC